jgi:hypothetical protein
MNFFMTYIQRKEMNTQNITKWNYHPLYVIPGPKRVVESENGGLQYDKFEDLYSSHDIIMVVKSRL